MFEKSFITRLVCGLNIKCSSHPLPPNFLSYVLDVSKQCLVKKELWSKRSSFSGQIKWEFYG